MEEQEEKKPWFKNQSSILWFFILIILVIIRLSPYFMQVLTWVMKEAQDTSVLVHFVLLIPYLVLFLIFTIFIAVLALITFGANEMIFWIEAGIVVVLLLWSEFKGRR